MKLTLPQQDVYFEQLLYPDEPIYNIGAKIAIRGPIYKEFMEIAYARLIDQHDAYRNILENSGDIPTFKVLDTHHTALGFEDCSMESHPDKVANAFMQKVFKKPFDLSAGELLHQFILVKVSDTFHYLFSVYHHIITDGWGTSLMFQRLVSNYNEIAEHGEVVTEYPYSYKDFVTDDESYFQSDKYIQDKAYWKGKFKHLPSHLLTRVGETFPVNKSRRKVLIVKRDVYDQLLNIATANSSSAFHVVLALLYLYFGRRYQNKDFAIGIPVLNRGRRLFKKTVGLFMGVSALRVDLDFESTFTGLIQQIKGQLYHDYRHQRFPLGKLLQELGAGNAGQSLFDITLSYEKQNYAMNFKGTQTTVIPMTHESERVPLAIYVREFDDAEDVKIDFDYNLNYFDEAIIGQVVTHLEQLIGQVAINVDKKLLDYQYLSLTEQDKLLYRFNETKFDFPGERTLLDCFEAQVKQCPNHVAVRDGNNAYTYHDLDRLSGQAAHYIIREGNNLKQGVVALLMSRSANMVAILLGILKSGNAYIPLDPDFPPARLDYIITHSGVQYIIGDDGLETTITAPAHFWDVETILNAAGGTDEGGVGAGRVQPSDTAYIIYTSGSTGKPKGVEIGHRSLLNFLLSIRQKPGIGQKDVLFSVTTPSFDISILEFFAPLVSGAELYIADKNTMADPRTLVERLDEVSPTVIQATPSFYQMLFDAGWGGDKRLKILCGGDALSKPLVENLLGSCAELWNMYGPTETTIWSSCKRITKVSEFSNIGKPINNTAFYVLDQHMQLLPSHTYGNIYIGGEGLAKSYFKSPDLTSQKFIPNPFDQQGKIYDTGDVGKWNDSGEIQFLGRNDNQVKIRGYRIELGEVESKLTEFDTIASAVVIPRRDEMGESFLMAYVVSQQGTVDPEEIIGRLRKELPEYMVPYMIITVGEFPLTPNKKVDRKSLGARDILPDSIRPAYRKPETVLETKLCAFYQEVLKIREEVSTTDHFFFLGGHSLSAVRLAGMVEKWLGYRVSLKTLFEHPTVASLARHLAGEEVQTLELVTRVGGQDYYPVTLPQHVIWLASLQKEKSIAYNMFRAFSVEGVFNEALLEAAFRQLVHKYESLRTNFVEREGSAFQKINPFEEVRFKVDKFSVDDETLEQVLEAYANRIFDLENDMLLRVGMFRLTSGDNIIIFVTHHIIMDGWSLEILINEMTRYYKVQLANRAPIQEVLDFQFKDCVAWQLQQTQSTQKVNHLFWQQYLEGYQWRPLIPYDQGSLQAKHAGAFYTFHWDKSFFGQLKRTARIYDITLHTLLVAVFNVLVYKITGQGDICIGTINSGRPQARLHDQIGMFVKTLPLRTGIIAQLPLADLLHKVHSDLMSVDQHQDIPQDVLSALRLEAIIVLQNPTFNYAQIDIGGGAVLKSHWVDAKYNRLPLLIDFSVNQDHFHGSVHYDTSKYEPLTIEIMMFKYQQALSQVIAHRDINVGDIDVGLQAEKKDMIDIDFNF